MPRAKTCRHCSDPLRADIEGMYGEHIDCNPPPRAAEVAEPTVPEVKPMFLDWSGKDGGPRAGVGDPKPCVACGKPTMLRHPDTGLPHHKTCAEQALAR